ncbi:MAG: arylamine N-acetyltransferase, partial [Sinobacteraceae bacterium]|nr:arylamine N-acetyltransferase [Nevskiaceae bacterium]
MLAANKNMEAGLDLDEYCTRIGYEGPRQPTVEVLHALTAAHSQSIPFENLDVVLGRPIQLEVEALYRKLVVARRGGYCFEQNGLFLEVLRALGFESYPLSARVRLGLAHRAQVAARTHLLVEVRIEGEAWLSDVGVGAASLTRVLRWQVDVEQPTPHEPRRLQYEEGRWFHQMYRGGEWV